MRRILITGGFGFLGSHLLDVLLADRENIVHVVDNLSTSPLPLDVLLKEIVPDERLTWDLEDMADYCRRYDGDPYDEIYHLASVVGPAGVLPHAGRISWSIINDSMVIAAMAREMNARLLDVSTSEIYGGGQEGYCSEDTPKIVPSTTSIRLEYAVGKLAAETSLLNQHSVHGLNIVIVRPFNITGPRQSGKGGFVLPRFIGQAMRGEPITVFGDGRQIRAFTDVRDMADGIVLGMRLGKAGQVYNLGNPANKCTIQEVAEDVKRVISSQSEIVHVDPVTIFGPHYAEASNKFPDAHRAMTELGWTPKYNRSAIIQRTWEYMLTLPRELFATLAGSQGATA